VDCRNNRNKHRFSRDWHFVRMDSNIISVLIPFAVMIAYGFVLALVAMYLDRWRDSKPQKPHLNQAGDRIEELIRLLGIPGRPTVTTSQK
jgi:hypothetical protein